MSQRNDTLYFGPGKPLLGPRALLAALLAAVALAAAGYFLAHGMTHRHGVRIVDAAAPPAAKPSSVTRAFGGSPVELKLPPKRKPKKKKPASKPKTTVASAAVAAAAAAPAQSPTQSVTPAVSPAPVQQTYVAPAPVHHTTAPAKKKSSDSGSGTEWIG